MLLLEESVLDGLELELELPLAGLFVVSLFVVSLDGLDGLDGEAADDGLDGVDGEAVEPDADEDDGLDGEVLLDGALAPRDALRSQPVTSAVPSARETAIANAENLMEPPWVGIQEEAASNGPIAAFPGLYFPSVLKSRFCAGSLESIWPPIFVGALLSPEAPLAPLCRAGLLVVGCGGVVGVTASLVFGAGVGVVFRLQPAKVSDNAAADNISVANLIQISGGLNVMRLLQGRGPA